MLGDTLPVRLSRKEVDRVLFYSYSRLCSNCRSEAQKQIEFHHHQDAVVQEEKNVSWIARWHCTIERNLKVKAEGACLDHFSIPHL
jgi:hypothetical protein